MYDTRTLIHNYPDLKAIFGQVVSVTNATNTSVVVKWSTWKKTQCVKKWKVEVCPTEKNSKVSFMKKYVNSKKQLLNVHIVRFSASQMKQQRMTVKWIFVF